MGELLLHWAMGIMDGDKLPEVMLQMFVMPWSWMRRTSNNENVVYHNLVGS